MLLEYDNPYAYIVDRLHWLNENEIKRHLGQMSNITIKNHILEYIKQELSESVSQAVGISDKLSKISTHTQEDSKENSICQITQSEDFKSLIRETKHIETQLLDGQAAHTEAIAKLKEMKLYFQNQFIKPLIIAYKTPRLKNDQAKHSHLEYDIKTTEVYLQILKYAENIYNTPNCVIADWLNTAVERQTNRNLKLSTQKYLDLFTQSRHVNANIIKFINQILLPENELLKNLTITKEQKESSPSTVAEAALFSENKSYSPTNETKITDQKPTKSLSAQEMIKEILASEPDSEDRAKYLHYLTQAMSSQENPMSILCTHL